MYADQNGSAAMQEVNLRNPVEWVNTHGGGSNIS